MPFGPKITAGAPGPAEEFFDLDVNGVQHRAVETLQEVLGIHVNRDLGPQTDEALTTLMASGNVPKAIMAYMQKREADRKPCSEVGDGATFTDPILRIKH